MEIVAILIALAAVGIACWALGETRKDDVEARLMAAEAAYMAHADNLTKKVRESMYGEKRIAALQEDMCDYSNMLVGVEQRMKRAFDDQSIWRRAIEQKLGVNLYRVEVPSQPGYSVYREEEAESGTSSETDN